MRFAIVVVMLIASLPAHGQDIGHDAHHASYLSWENSEPIPKGCCNGVDCKPIAEAEERESGAVIEVYVRGVGVAFGAAEWCPIMRHHYLSKGNVPDASVSHICVTAYYGGLTPCQQLVCYQPRPRI